MFSKARLRDLAGTLALAALLASTACTGEAGDGLPPPASPPPAGTPAPTVDDPEHQAILDVYHGAIAAMVAAHEASDPDHPDLLRYYIERTPALDTVQRVIERHGSRGAHYSGTVVVVSAAVTDVDLDAIPARARIEACLDDTDFDLVFLADGSPVPGTEPGGRYTVSAGALLGNDDRWYIVESTSHWDEPC